MLLYELLTGKTPFDPKTLLAAGLDEMRRIIREQEPPKPSTRLTQELERVARMGSARGSRAESGGPPDSRSATVSSGVGPPGAGGRTEGVFGGPPKKAPGPGVLKVGSSHQARVYLNGKRVYQYLGDPRAYWVPEEVPNLELKKGLNVVVFTVVHTLGDWLGLLRFTDVARQPLKGIQVTLDPEGKDLP